MLQHPRGTWTWGRCVVLHSAGNVDVAAGRRYRGLVADESTFATSTLVALLDGHAVPKAHEVALRARYVVPSRSSGADLSWTRPVDRAAVQCAPMNDHGHLPKTQRRQLSSELEERLTVWYEKAYEDDNLFLTLARRPAVLNLFLDWVRFVYTDASRLSPKLVELCRVRSAVQNECVH